MTTRRQSLLDAIQAYAPEDGLLGNWIVMATFHGPEGGSEWRLAYDKDAVVNELVGMIERAKYDLLIAVGDLAAGHGADDEEEVD